MDHQSMTASAAAEFFDAGKRAFADGKAGTVCPYRDSDDYLPCYLWQYGNLSAHCEAAGLRVSMTAEEVLNLADATGQAFGIFCKYLDVPDFDFDLLNETVLAWLRSNSRLVACDSH
jgi:hypothetical protein